MLTYMLSQYHLSTIKLQKPGKKERATANRNIEIPGRKKSMKLLYRCMLINIYKMRGRKVGIENANQSVTHSGHYIGHGGCHLP